jgi:hypothetical protein
MKVKQVADYERMNDLCKQITEGRLAITHRFLLSSAIDVILPYDLVSAAQRRPGDRYITTIPVSSAVIALPFLHAFPPSEL